MVAWRPVLGEEWELVGRGRVLRLIETAAAAGGGIALCGPPGVGKTRLAREALAHLAKAGRPVEWVAATRAARAIPFGAVSHLLPDRGGDRAALLRGMAERFELARPVVAVDDAHLLDAPSAAAVHHLALRSPAFLLVTIRYGERCPDAVTALWKDGPVRRVELDALPGEAIDELLDQTFTAGLDALTRRRLAAVSAGNPLLLRETLRAGLDTGALRHRHGVWRWTGELTPTTRLVEVVAARLDGVSAAEQRVLELVVCGEPLPAAILDRLSEVDDIARAERRGLVVIERSGRRTLARLSHPLYGEVIRSTMARSRARTTAAELADAFCRTPMRRRDDALRVGLWRLRAGRHGDPKTLLTAAKQALRRFDVTLAARLAKAASDSGGGWAAEHTLAQVLSNAGWYEESVRVLPGAPDTGDAAARTRWAIVRADILYWGHGRVAEAERALDEAGTATAAAYRGLILMFDSRCAESLALAQDVLGRGDAEPQALVWAAVAASASAGILGDHARARASYERGLAVAADHPDDLPWGRVQVCCGYCMALLATGRVDEAFTISEREYRAARTVEPLGTWAGFHGVVAKTRGDLDRAARTLRESLTLLARYDTFRLAAPCLAAFAGVRALGGDGVRAARLMDRADRPQRRTSRLFLPWMELDRAWTQAASGDTTTAAATARRAAALARYAGQPTIEAWALYDAARLGDAPAVHARLAELAAVVPGPAMTAFATAAAGLAADDPERLERATEALRRLGLRLHAAETATAAGTLQVRAGRRTRATLLMERATELRQACPDARTPLLNNGELPTTLTRREREIVKLAAEGLSSKQIAEKLTLSARTVDNHLGRAYAKLGIRGRADLRQA